MATYSEKLLDPRWQKKRLSILNRDEFRCQYCYDNKKTLHVHHLYYEKNIEPWEAKDEHLVTLCNDCHTYFHEDISKSHEQIINNIKLKLKDPFITSCAVEVTKNYENLHDLIYLLFELSKKEVEILDYLTNLFRETTQINKNVIKINGK